MLDSRCPLLYLTVRDPYPGWSGGRGLVEETRQSSTHPHNRWEQRQLCLHSWRSPLVASSGCFLVRFCFEDEEFQLIELPPGFPELGGSLHEFRGVVALVTGVMDWKLHMWVLCRKCDDEEKWSEEWSERTLRIPYAFADRGCCLLGNLPTGLMLMTGTSIEQEDEQQQEQLEEEVVYNMPFARSNTGRKRIKHCAGFTRG
ncbi:uncharacterized protein LOC131313436 isoform X2 [Rhododendron vialii]|uniref:uncharacterized protein LOC131313436 isoform X2 n=1 Tax=Rhododendron vialii TaxID=182163 RepID=UPI00265DF7F5|nr:uncharacterized protein LOC131313436 isoform X2 [Rhododendron vialii]